MPTPGYLLNKYQRTLGSKTGLLQKRLAIEGDISAKKYAADQKKLVQGINIVGTAGAGLAEYSTAKKGGYEGGLMGYLGEKAKEHYGLDDGTTTTTMAGGKTITERSSGGTGVKETDYRVAFDIGVDERRKAAGKWWENVKGLVPKSIGESKVGKHWKSEGKDFLKKSLGIGKPREAKLQSGEKMTTAAQQPSYSGSISYTGEYGEHYEPEPYVAKQKQETSTGGLIDFFKSTTPEPKLQGGGKMPTAVQQMVDDPRSFWAKKPPTTREGDLAKLSFPKEETVGSYNLRTQHSPDYQGDFRTNEEFLESYMEAGGDLNDLLLQAPMNSRRKPKKKIGAFNWGRR